MGRQNADPRNEQERQPTVKICDFTTAVKIPLGQEDTFKVSLKAGTLAFNAPEQFIEQNFLPKPLDVWAFGITLFVFLTNSLPFLDKPERDIKNYE